MDPEASIKYGSPDHDSTFDATLMKSGWLAHPHGAKTMLIRSTSRLLPSTRDQSDVPGSLSPDAVPSTGSDPAAEVVTGIDVERGSIGAVVVVADASPHAVTRTTTTTGNTNLSTGQEYLNERGP